MVNVIIWLSGPTGGGKTSFAGMLAGLGYSVVAESLPVELFETFAVRPGSVCAALQESIMVSRYDAFRSLSNCSVVFDRSVEEDFDIFCRLHHENGLITDRDFERLGGIAADIRARLPQPDLIVYLRCSSVQLRSRVTGATHPPAIADTLDRQMALYSKWRAGRSEEVLDVDTTSIRAGTLRRLFTGERSC